MALTFPLKFENGIPWIYFKAYEYQCPIPGIDTITNLAGRKEAGANIGLYMPGNFTESASADWAPEDVFTGSGGNWLATAASNAIKGIGEKQGGHKVISSLSALSARSPFPTDIMIFRNVNPLGFTLNFDMIPYDKAEGDAIVEIIQTFKKFMMPQIDNSTAIKGVVLKFPPVWDLSFEGIKGLGITESKYRNMAITNCSVSYVSGNEGASVYHDKNPTQVKLSLTFTAIQKFFLE
jgi:hypothetical protein